MDIYFKKPKEIVQLLCERLRKERITQQMTQAEVAARAGVGVNTLSNLEAGRNTSFESLVRVATVLRRLPELEDLFKPKLESLDDMVRYEASAKRHRVKKKLSKSMSTTMDEASAGALSCPRRRSLDGR